MKNRLDKIPEALFNVNLHVALYNISSSEIWTIYINKQV